MQDRRRQTRKQQSLKQRLGMAIGATAVAVGLALAIALAGYLPMRAVLVFAGGAAVCAVIFSALVRSGANLRFSDPSLSVPMLLAAGAMTTYVVSMGPQARVELASIYLIAFMFGTLTLDARRLAWVALCYIGFYALMIAFSSSMHADTTDVPRELFRLFVFALLLGWFTVLGSYFSGLRAKLRTANEELTAALRNAQVHATTDALTGCSNRRQVFGQLQIETRRAGRGGAVSVGLVDMDHFKSINDVHGHAAGDEVLKAFVVAALRSLRPTDALGRWGGEEFLIVLSQTRLAAALAAAERLRRMMEQLVIPALPEGRRVTVSIGVAEHRPGEPVESTLERADLALYRAKQGGRNRVEAAT